MTKPRVPMGAVIGRALIAPLYLEAASWKALVRSLITLVLVGLLPVVAGYFRMGWVLQLIAFGFLWAAILWLAWNFERHLLLGAAAGESDPRLRQRYGLNLLILVVGGLLLAVVIWHLLQWVLAAIVFLHLAASDNNPLPSVAYVLGWIVAISVAGSFPVRFVLLLPAAAAGHDIAPKRIWRLTRGNGLRLFLVLVILPGVLAGYGQLAFASDRGFPGSAIVAGLLTAYGGMVYLAVLAWAYRSLSGMPLPDLEQGAGARLLRANARRLWAALAIVGTGHSAVGAPLTVADNSRLGTLCVIDSTPRAIDPERLKILEVMRDAVVAGSAVTPRISIPSSRKCASADSMDATAYSRRWLTDSHSPPTITPGRNSVSSSALPNWCEGSPCSMGTPSIPAQPRQSACSRTRR